MKILIVFMLLVGSAQANTNIRLVKNLNKCRKDFAVELCRKQPDIYKCYSPVLNGKQYLTWDEMFGKDALFAQKINRRNMIIWGNHCVAVPNDLTNILKYSPFSNEYKTDYKKIILVDLNKLAWASYQDNKLVKWGPANGGKGICVETGKYECKTPAGTHSVLKIEGPVIKSKLYPVECKDSKTCGHPMYFMIKFARRGEGLHGDQRLPGRNVSHGCVRLLKQDAKWLNKQFVNMETKIIVLLYKVEK